MIYRFKKTFIGVGGREYINNPKLSFPEHVKIRRKGTDPKSGQPYASASGAFMETSSIAARLRWQSFRRPAISAPSWEYASA